MIDSFPHLPPVAALILFAVWALLLVITIGVWRVGQVVAGSKRAGEFPAGTQHGSAAYWRLNRAHLNTLENLPIFGAIVLSGVSLQINDAMFNLLPTVIVGFRFAQSLIHIASGASFAVTLRFSCYLVQVLCMLALAGCILMQVPNLTIP